MLPVRWDPTTVGVTELEGWCTDITDWSWDAGMGEAIDVLHKLEAIELYLAKRGLEGPLQIAERHLERRIGELLGPARNGGDRVSDQFQRVETGRLKPTTQHNYRRIADFWEVIEPNAQISQAEALRRVADYRRFGVGLPDTEEDPPAPDAPPTYTVPAWLALDDATQSGLLGYRGTKTFNRQSTDNIEWARWSWNPITGCEHNCPYCYARDIAIRLFPDKFVPVLHPERLAAPENTPVPPAAETEMGYRNVFVCSMADLFGKWVPEEWIRAVLTVVEENPQWNFLFLTKFPIRLAEFAFPDNAWVGTTVDCQARVANAEQSFRRVDAKVKWLSVEPMLEPLHFADLGAFDWVVIGGASAVASAGTPEWRPPRDWSDDLRRAAAAAGCMVYEKTNLLERIRDYPGEPRADARSLPKSLAYIPSIGA